MSNAFIKKVSKELLGYLEKDLRKPLNRLAGQLYILDKNIFMLSMEEIIVDIYRENYKTLDQETLNKLDAVKEEVFNSHKTAVVNSGLKLDEERKRDINELISRLGNQGYPLPSDSLFYIPVLNYNRVAKIKTASGLKFEKLLKEVVGLSAKKAAKARALSGGRNQEQGLHLGHGDFGIAVSAAKGKQLLTILETKLAKSRSKANKAALQSIYSRIIEYDKSYSTSVALEKEQIFDSKGRLKGSFIAIISSQLTQANLRDALEEGDSYKSLRQYFKENLKGIKGSESLEEAFQKVSVANFTAVKRRKGVKVTSKIKPKSLIKSKSKGKSTKRGKVKQKANILADSGVKAKVKMPQKTIVESVNYLSLKALINAKLPAQVRLNMGYPALVNRTGRFAASAQVTDIVPTAKGFPSIGYSYMKNPYQTFEPGFRQGSEERDPKKLIDRSIRDIVKDILEGRFYTRRM